LLGGIKHASQDGALLIQHPYSCNVIPDDDHTQAVPVLHNTDKPPELPTSYDPDVTHVLQGHVTIFNRTSDTLQLQAISYIRESHPYKAPPRPISFDYMTTSSSRKWPKKASSDL